VLTLDTSGILAALNAQDAYHEQAVAALRDDGGPFIVPAGIMAEAAYMIKARLRPDAPDAFLADLHDGAFSMDCGEGDLPRIRTLVTRYRDLPLGYADAAVVACAERTSARVLTFDRRHFIPVAREGTVRLAAVDRECGQVVKRRAIVPGQPAGFFDG
jgi:predicted nucleic acid-binding protein